MRLVVTAFAIAGLAWPVPVTAQPGRAPQLQQWINSLAPVRGAGWGKCHSVPLDARAPHPGPAYGFYTRLKAEYRLRPYFAFDGGTDDPRFSCRQRAFVSGNTIFHVQDIRYLTAGPNVRVNKVRVCSERFIRPNRNGLTPAFFQGAQVNFDGRGCYTRWTGVAL